MGAQASSNSTMASVEAGMTLEDAGEDHDRTSTMPDRTPSSRGCWRRAAFRAGPADPALPSRRRVQAQRQVERLGGGPERLVLGLVVAAVLGWILGDHRAGEAQAGGALQLLDPVLDIVQIDHRDAL